MKRLNRTAQISGMIGALLIALSQLGAQVAHAGESIVDAVGGAPGGTVALERLAGMLARQSELAGTLEGKGSFTMFAPSNAAIDELRTLDRCGAIKLNDRLVNTLLNYHVVRGETPRPEHDSLRIESRLGAPLTLTAEQVTDASGASANITQTVGTASNGVIHVIDRVLWPYQAPRCS